MGLNPVGQYADDRNLRARQRFWDHQEPPFDIYGWVLDLAGVRPEQQVLDVGCGNGGYLRAMRAREVDAVGCDLSLGMLDAARPHRRLANADVVALPFPAAAFDVVLAPHMLYHVTDREAAARELRRVLAPGGVGVVVTNGSSHLRAVKALVEEAVREATPGWQMRSPSVQVFSLDNGEAQLRTAFASVEVVPADQAAPVSVHDAELVAAYVASVGDIHQEHAGRPWAAVVDHVRQRVQAVIDAEGVFVVAGQTGAFVCR